MSFGSPTRRKRDKYCSGMWVCEWAQVGSNKNVQNWAHLWYTRVPPRDYVVHMRVYAPRREVLNRKDSAELYLEIAGLPSNLFRLKATATATGERFELPYVRPFKLLPKRKKSRVKMGTSFRCE
jgi:hypothetical protein